MASCMMVLNYLDKEKVSLDKWKDMCLNDKTYDFGGISMGQYVDGVDVFYRDYRHRNLEISFALDYVRDSVRGKSQQELDAEVAEWQKIETGVKK